MAVIYDDLKYRNKLGEEKSLESEIARVDKRIDDWDSGVHDGEDGADGKSAYEIWLEQGNSGTEEDFIASLKGEDGATGANGKSAYHIWLDEGNTGTEADFIASLKGAKGAKGDKGEDAYSEFDVVIRTNEELIYQNSAAVNWAGVRSVAIVGDVGFTYTHMVRGLKFPTTVKRIQGFNDAKIRIGNFAYSDTNKGGIWYAEPVNQHDYYISGISLIVEPTETSQWYGFYNCGEVDKCSLRCVGKNGTGVDYYYCKLVNNCASYSTSEMGFIKGFDYCDEVRSSKTEVLSTSNQAVAFSYCGNVTNCSFNISSGSTNTSAAFDSCSFIDNVKGTTSHNGTDLNPSSVFSFCRNINNCEIEINGGFAVAGFRYCDRISNANIKASGANVTHGFYECKWISNIYVESTGNTGYILVNCSHISNIRGKFTTGFASGTTLYMDNDSCKSTSD